MPIHEMGEEMKLTEMTVSQFIDTLYSDAPAPGGGSAAALSGALGISLVAMVAALTAGKEKYKEYDALMQDILERSQGLKEKLTHAIDADTEAFNGVSAVFAMPKATEEDKANRKAAMQEALKEAARVPLDVMHLAVDALGLAEAALGKANPNAASDLGVAAIQLKTALQGAWLNVCINLSGIQDESFVADCRAKGQACLNRGVAYADRVYEGILSQVQ